MIKHLKSALKGTQKAFKKQSAKQIIGNQAEALARQFLLAKGLKFIQSQFRTPLGEIDLIMMDKAEIVFIEVRYRKNSHFGEGYETVSYAKQRRLIRTAECFQKRKPWSQAYPCRIDVISISGDKLNPKITWIPNAFGVK